MFLSYTLILKICTKLWCFINHSLNFLLAIIQSKPVSSSIHHPSTFSSVYAIYRNPSGSLCCWYTSISRVLPFRMWFSPTKKNKLSVAGSLIRCFINTLNSCAVRSPGARNLSIIEWWLFLLGLRGEERVDWVDLLAICGVRQARVDVTLANYGDFVWMMVYNFLRLLLSLF